MIHWMSDRTEKIWDETCPWLMGFVCEIHDPELKGHIVIELEANDEDSWQIDLGDCTGLEDAMIDRRFCETFANWADDNEDEIINALGMASFDIQHMANRLRNIK